MASDETAAPVRRPDLECDIVMAGGVTSGIIYPGAVFEIAKRYVFRSIGGTSVGAIAAAVTAAAEYGRLTGKNPNAFDQIAAMPGSLGAAAPDGHSRLFHLFTPEPATRRLYAFIMPLFSGGAGLSRACRVISEGLSAWRVGLPTALALVLGAFPLISIAWTSAEIWFVVGLFFSMMAIVCTALAVWSTSTSHIAIGVFLAGMLIAIASSIYIAGWADGVQTALLVAISLTSMIGLSAIAFALATVAILKTVWLPALAANRYGICTGLTNTGIAVPSGEQPFLGLTNWMHAEVQRAAGRTDDDPPLTFGDLWAATGPGIPLRGDESAIKREARQRTIDLAMIASDISRNRTAQLPFLELRSQLYVKIEVLEAFFPPVIVKAMVSTPQATEPPFQHDPTIIRLPEPADMPIVFAARLSLSFPILLSAFPMQTVRAKRGADGETSLVGENVWFSDGGLTSNFPIHFFDSPIPSRPTFCLNLVDFGTAVGALPARVGRGATVAGPSMTPRLQHSDLVELGGAGDDLPVQFTDFDKRGLGAFFSALLNTARFWSDNELLGAPGVRERVVNIALREDEGGLNLDMPKPKIDELNLRGRAAGALIAEHFYPGQTKPNGSHFANHRWVRYRNFMAAFEDLTWRFARAYQLSDEKAGQRGEPLLMEMIEGRAPDPRAFQIPQHLRPFFARVTKRLMKSSLALAAGAFYRNESFDVPYASPLTGGSPRPKMRFRLRPIVNSDPRLAHADLPIPYGPNPDGTSPQAGRSTPPPEF